MFGGWLNCLLNFYFLSHFLCVLDVIDVATGFCVPNEFSFFSYSFAASGLVERKFMSDKKFQPFKRMHWQQRKPTIKTGKNA